MEEKSSYQLLREAFEEAIGLRAMLQKGLSKGQRTPKKSALRLEDLERNFIPNLVRTCSYEERVQALLGQEVSVRFQFGGILYKGIVVVSHKPYLDVLKPDPETKALKPAYLFSAGLVLGEGKVTIPLSTELVDNIRLRALVPQNLSRHELRPVLQRAA